jgi:hypothetical protein
MFVDRAPIACKSAASSIKAPAQRGLWTQKGRDTMTTADRTNDAAAMPTREHLDAALRALGDVAEPFVKIQWQVGKVARGEGSGRRPTLADIGALYVFASDAAARLDEIRDYVEGIRGQLIALDCIREGTVLETGLAVGERIGRGGG